MAMENFGTLLGRIDTLTAEKRGLLRDMEGMSWLARERAAARVSEIEGQVEACYVAMRTSRATEDAAEGDPLVAERRAYTRRVFGLRVRDHEDPAPATPAPAPPPAPIPGAAAVVPVSVPVVRALRAPRRDWLGIGRRAAS